MNKIPTLYRRDPNVNQRYVLDGVVVAGCEWVLAGEGTPTRKYDGTCVLHDENGWWARREVKPGKDAPAGFVVADHDPVTGKTVGWEPMEQSAFAKWHAEAVARGPLRYAPTYPNFAYGTYELCGPKVNGNPERFEHHRLISHETAEVLAGVEPAELIALCREHGFEGVVWHHPDGRRAKLKVKDYPREAQS